MTSAGEHGRQGRDAVAYAGGAEGDPGAVRVAAVGTSIWARTPVAC